MPRKQGQEHRSFDACIFFGYRDRREKGTLCTVQSSHQWGIVIRYYSFLVREGIVGEVWTLAAKAVKTQLKLHF